MTTIRILPRDTKESSDALYELGTCNNFEDITFRESLGKTSVFSRDVEIGIVPKTYRIARYKEIRDRARVEEVRVKADPSRPSRLTVYIEVCESGLREKQPQIK